MDLYDPNYRYRKIEEDKQKFEQIDLNKRVKEIYFEAINKAENDFGQDIINEWEYLIKTNYTEEQAQEKFNYFIDDIRIKNEEDNSDYRIIKNQLLNNNDIPKEDKQEVIINALCFHINESLDSHSQKLDYLKKLPEQIYKSNKVSRQFEFIRNQAEKEKKEEKEINTSKKDFEYLNSLFRNTEDYFQIIDLLLKENFISKIDEYTFDWFGSIIESTLKPKKLLGTLAYILKTKKYFHSNVNKKIIADSFSKTFPNTTLSEVYYGRIENKLSNAFTNSIEEDYKTSFHFIPNK